VQRCAARGDRFHNTAYFVDRAEPQNRLNAQRPPEQADENDQPDDDGTDALAQLGAAIRRFVEPLSKHGIPFVHRSSCPSRVFGDHRGSPCDGVPSRRSPPGPNPRTPRWLYPCRPRASTSPHAAAPYENDHHRRSQRARYKTISTNAIAARPSTRRITRFVGWVGRSDR